MNSFSAHVDHLSREFLSHGIPTENPGFCDHPAFLEVEKEDPRFLNHYAAYIAKRSYSPDYLKRARTVIENAARLMHAELVDHGRLGACVDISGILSKILDKEGIWNCILKGSLTTTFPSASGIGQRFYWSVDSGNFVAGHAWIFAPPFTVADISVRQQPMAEKERAFIPEIVLSTETTPAKVELEDIISPNVRQLLLAQGVPKHRQLAMTAPFIPEIFEAFPVIRVATDRGSSLKYAPVAVGAPDGTLENLQSMRFNGLTPWELYQQKFKGHLGIETIQTSADDIG